MSNFIWFKRRYFMTDFKKARNAKSFAKRVRISKSKEILNGIGWQRELGFVISKSLIHNGRKP